jgi:hypothetical protein
MMLNADETTMLMFINHLEGIPFSKQDEKGQALLLELKAKEYIFENEDWYHLTDKGTEYVAEHSEEWLRSRASQE